MKMPILVVSLLLLCGCFSPQRAFEDDPAGYGLYVATTNIFANSDVVVQQEGSGEIFILKNKHSYGGDSTAYIVASLPPGRYHLETYSPDGRSNYPITTDNGWFEVQANCYNYGGYYEFQQGADGMPSYKNTTTLQDIQNLPGHYKDMAEDRDVCSATMGQPSERLAAADVAKVLTDL
jgi:hypothetical protein